jgi:hypothetical protein
VPNLEVVPATPLERLLHCEVPNRLEHRESGLARDPLFLAKQALLDERGEGVEQIGLQLVGAHLLDGVEAGAADEDGDAGEQRAIGLVEEVVTPGDGTAQRLLALRKVA